jgi:hypothetical protein
MNGAKINAHMVLVGKLEEKKPLRTPRSRWVTNIKMDIREIVRPSMDGIDLAQYSEHGNGISGSINCGAVFE